MTSERKPERPDGITPSQTVGPFFHYALSPDGNYPLPDLVTARLATPDAVGERIRIEGRIVDGDDQVVADSLVEIWQADGSGRYPSAARDARANTAFQGFGRAACDSTGAVRFRDGEARPRRRWSAPHQRFDLRARHPAASAHAHLF